MTNGELFFKTFPCLEQDEQWTNLLWWTDEKGKRQLLGDVYDSDFWNAEYKEPTAKKCTTCAYREIDGKPHEMCKSCVCGDRYREEPTTKNTLGVDTVSRKDVHDMLENLPITVEDKWFNWLQKACMRLAELPSVTPQPRKGHWIYDYTSADGHRIYHCSECGCYLKPKHTEPLNSFKWCSLCGADMRISEEHDV